MGDERDREETYDKVQETPLYITASVEALGEDALRNLIEQLKKHEFVPESAAEQRKIGRLEWRGHAVLFKIVEPDEGTGESGHVTLFMLDDIELDD